MIKKVSFLQVAFFVFMIFYGYLLYDSISQYWFNPMWTTDDAYQQAYPFHKIHNAELFQGDLITKAMELYLPPLHYAIAYAVTWLCGDVYMMTHWVMLIQVVLTLLFMFLAVKKLAGSVPAFFAVTWLMHTRQIMQRLTGGLPRGWSAVILTAYFYLILTNRHKSILVLIFAGALLNPPAALVVALSYGLIVLLRFISTESRSEYKKHLIRGVVAAPILFAVVYFTNQKPAEIGQMVSYEEASQMPAFNVGGRFQFLPLKSASSEIKRYALSAFTTKAAWHKPSQVLRDNALSIVCLITAMVLILALYRRRTKGILEFATFLCAIFAAYFAARIFAFKLFVPDRYLLFPMGILLITMLSSIGWQAFALTKQEEKGSDIKHYWISALYLLMITGVVYALSGSGIYGIANYNSSFTKYGHLWAWVKKETPMNALIAGHPSHIDGVQYFGMRQGYATSETVHPFYPVYYNELERRLAISLRAHYAANLRELYNVLEPEKIDYFVFRRKNFYPKELKSAKYHAPLDKLVKELTTKEDLNEFAYKELPSEVDLKNYPFLVYKDQYSAVIDIKKLNEYLDEKKL